MSTPNQTTALGIVRCTYSDMIGSLSPSVSTLVSLSWHLVEADLVAQSVVASVERCESPTECQELLVSVLLSLGMGKFTKVKEALRNFTKDQNEPESKPRTKSPKLGAHSSEEVKDNGPKHRKVEKHELYAKLQTFSLLLYTVIEKLVHSHTTSSTVRQRLPWLRPTLNPASIRDYFPPNALTGLNDVTDESITVSLETVMESFKQVWKHVQREIREEKKKEKEHHMQSQSTEERKKESKGKELATQNKELLMINKQWSIECEEKNQEIAQLQSEIKTLRAAQTPPTINDDEIEVLKATIEDLTAQVESGNEAIERYKETIEEMMKERSLSRESKEDSYALKLQELQELKHKCTNLEKKLSSSESKVTEFERLFSETISKEEHQQLMTEKEYQLEVAIHHEVDQREKISALEEEQKCLQETNEALLKDLESLRKESEEDKNYIEELKDQVANLRLNANMKEPSVREITELLAKNRHLEEEKTQLDDRLVEVTTEKNRLQKELGSAKDELMAYQTHLEELRGVNKEKDKMSSKHMRRTDPTNGYYRQRNPELADLKVPHGANGSRHASRGHGYHDASEDPSSFRSQQRTCPACDRIFLTLTDVEFTRHVAGCFK